MGLGGKTVGCTYCAVAALRMLGRLADLPSKDLFFGGVASRFIECPAFDRGMSMNARPGFGLRALHLWENMIPERRVFTFGVQSASPPSSPPASSPSSPRHHPYRHRHHLLRLHRQPSFSIRLVMSFVFMCWVHIPHVHHPLIIPTTRSINIVIVIILITMTINISPSPLACFSSSWHLCCYASPPEAGPTTQALTLPYTDFM